MADMGAKILQIRSVELARKFKVPLLIKSSFGSDKCTWIVEEEKRDMESAVISGIILSHNEAKPVSYTHLDVYKRQLLNEALEEVEARSPEGTPRPRILVWGSLLDNIAFYRMIEEAGGEVAADDTCIGFRLFEKDIPATGDPDEGLKEHYFVNFQCPRTDRGPGTGRFDYLLERAREYNVDGVISYIISFCDPHKFDYPDLRDYLKEADFPMLLIDDNYSFTPAGTIQTRLQAFIELLAR